MLLRLKQQSTKKEPKKIYKIRVPKNVGQDQPPLYVPHPDSLLPHRRCFRTTCRAIKPIGINRCLVCGSLIDSAEPLVKYVVYIEEF